MKINKIIIIGSIIYLLITSLCFSQNKTVTSQRTTQTLELLRELSGDSQLWSGQTGNSLMNSINLALARATNMSNSSQVMVYSAAQAIINGREEAEFYELVGGKESGLSYTNSYIDTMQYLELGISPQLLVSLLKVVYDREFSNARGFRLMEMLNINATQASSLVQIMTNMDFITWDYDYKGNGIFITQYNGSDTTLSIPERINGLTVIGIETRKQLEFGEQHGIINYQARITNINIPSSVQYIGDFSFNFGHLTHIIIPNSVRSIGRFAFGKNDNLNIITIPSNLELVEGTFGNGFVGLYNFLGKRGGLYTVSVIENLEWVYAKWTHNNSSYIIITRFKGNSQSVIIPSNFNSIPVIGTIGIVGAGAGSNTGIFAWYAKNVSSCIIQDGIRYIGPYSFATDIIAGNLLSSIIIPNSIILINKGAFAGNNLTSITIGRNVTMEEDSFDNRFVQYYIQNGRQAGIYTFSNGNWSK